jgi:hypothetical protein
MEVVIRRPDVVGPDLRYRDRDRMGATSGAAEHDTRHFIFRTPSSAT